MTAINFIAKKDRAFFITDAAVYQSDGILMGSLNKVHPVPHLRMAMACQGSLLLSAYLPPLLGMQFDTFDDLVDHGAALAAEVIGSVAPQLQANGNQSDLSVIAGGWSDREQRFVGYVFATIESEIGDPWVFTRIDEHLWMVPEMDGEKLVEVALARRDKGILAIIDNLESFDPYRSGATILEAQRSTRTTPYGLSTGDIPIVGGYGLVTEITRDGSVSQRIIARWNDKRGELIDPELSAAALPAPSLNRQQRRHPERASRRA